MGEQVAFSREETLLNVSHVNLSYGDNVVLRDIDTQVKHIRMADGRPQGQVIGIVGLSGCGKTSLFRIIAGLSKPSSGQVLVNSTGIPVRAGMVGVVAQSYPLFEHRTIIGNLMLGAVKKAKDHADAKINCLKYLERFGLQEHIHKYPSQLSGGQRQRIAIIQQLLSSDHFLLMDEPFSGLDLVMEDKVAELIVDVSKMDSLNTIIVVTHDVTAACTVADTVWVLGRERDGEGRAIPGSRIVESYDLAAMGLAWHPELVSSPEFVDFVRQVKDRLRSL